MPTERELAIAQLGATALGAMGNCCGCSQGFDEFEKGLKTFGMTIEWRQTGQNDWNRDPFVIATPQ